MEAATTSFASRRPAAHGLPQFHLPVPNPPIDIQVPRVPSSDGTSPLSSGVNSGSSQSPQAGIASYSSHHSGWSLPASSSYTFGSTNHGVHSGPMQSNYNRPTFSPTGYTRNSQSPATADGMSAHSPYDGISHSYSLPTPGGGGGHTSLLSQHSSQPSLANPMMTSHAPGSQPPPPPSSTASAHDSYSRPPTSSNYYSAAPAAPHQPSFPPFTSSSAHPSPTQPSPTTAGPLPRGMPTFSPQHHQHHHQHHHQPSPIQAPHYSNRPPPSYGYPPLSSSMGGAVLSNMANPGGQMTLVGPMNPMSHGYHHPHHLSPHGMYHSQPNQQQDRPFKCDVCPQSFNRNHDLKRHKRIHLAIKPFPCTFCDKSFSRKDALKRHRLVKGCGNGKTTPTDGSETRHQGRGDVTSPGPGREGRGRRSAPPPSRLSH
ncbi:hypothetical protein GGS23DRAFT_195297 [Durotheca rogersii]|uniref:uncharacterized protein n=1 Tax=Durotheca rogersii TaxID=419775 RepID=UPI00221E9399|nr:uncharacterized protein GGS23DRAFT_195297 [Durotheca rogersii]KAI5867781.1 hypothetical protein GGS23DRAFT_195297 [Durotheca rogersii]